MSYAEMSRNMAAMISPLEVNESLLKCSICVNTIKEPKLLPCLHRFCRDCLHGKTTKSSDKIQCPACRIDHKLPANGVEGLQTDVAIYNILQLHRIQSAILNDTRKHCMICQSKSKPNGFCFKCDGFLCKSCCNNHTSLSNLQQHQPYTLALREMRNRKITLKDVSSFTNIARCSDHPKHVLDICCKTCLGNQPFCKYCSVEEHQGHVLRDIKDLASEERKLLNQKMDGLSNHLQKIKETRQSAKKGEEGNLNRVFERRTCQAQDEFDRKEAIIKLHVDSEVKRLDRGILQLEHIMSITETSIKKREIERKLKMLNDEHDKLCREAKREKEIAFEALKQENKINQEKILNQLANLKQDFEATLDELQSKVSCHRQQIQNTKDFCDQMESRLKNVHDTVSAQFTMQNDWVDIQSIPIIRSVIEVLDHDMNRTFSDLSDLSHIRIGTFGPDDRELSVDISEKAENVIGFDGIFGKKWNINSISGNENGTVVATGESSRYRSHITILGNAGEMLHQHEIKSDFEVVCRYCEFVTSSKVVTVCWNKESGIFNVEDGTYEITDLREEIRQWPEGREVSCVAVDHLNNDVFIGVKDSRDVYVLDDQLNYSHFISLPAVVRWPRDIAVRGNNLIVCDRAGMDAYIIALSGKKGKLIGQFNKPKLESGDCWPIAVCRDRVGLIYLLWSSVANTSWKRLLAQYSCDGRDLQTARLMDDEAWCISTAGTENGDMLLVSTWKSGKIFQYRLCQDSVRP